MHKLIVVHENNELILVAMVEKFTHHIKCPYLLLLGMVDDDKPIAATELVASMTEVQNKYPHTIVFITHETRISTCLEEYYPHLNIFNVTTSPTTFAANQKHPGVWVSSTEEVDYAFNQIVNWTFDNVCQH